MYQIILYFILCSALCISIACVSFNPEKSQRMIPIFLVYNLISEGIAYQWMIAKRSNMFIYDVYTIIEFVFMFALFYQAFSSKRMKAVLLYYAILFFAGATLYYGGWYQPTHYNVVSLLMSYLFILVVSGSYLIEQLFSNQVLYFTTQPMFWASTGFLIYGSASFLINMLNYLNLVSPSFSFVKQLITIVGSLAFYGGLSMSMLCRKVLK